MTYVDRSQGTPEAHHRWDRRVSLGHLLSLATQLDLGGGRCRIERGSGQAVHLWSKRRDTRANAAGQNYAVASSSCESDFANGRLCSACLWHMDAFNSLHHSGDVVGLPRSYVGLAQSK
jgi:hypothetical protein